MGHRAQVVDALAHGKAPDSGDERPQRQLLLGHVVSQLAGRASVETTKLYDRRGEQAKMRAVERLGLG